MVDRISPEHRSWNMSRIRAIDTNPEIAARSLLHRMGYRFSLHRKDLPGKPDIVLPKHKTVIFVHGCYWHRHPRCQLAYSPKSRVEFWKTKFKSNVARDKRNQKDLKRLGWEVAVIWECDTKSEETLEKRIIEIFKPRRVTATV